MGLCHQHTRYNIITKELLITWKLPKSMSSNLSRISDIYSYPYPHIVKLYLNTSSWLSLVYRWLVPAENGTTTILNPLPASCHLLNLKHAAVWTTNDAADPLTSAHHIQKNVRLLRIYHPHTRSHTQLWAIIFVHSFSTLIRSWFWSPYKYFLLRV